MPILSLRSSGPETFTTIDPWVALLAHSIKVEAKICDWECLTVTQEWSGCPHEAPRMHLISLSAISSSRSHFILELQLAEVVLMALAQAGPSSMWTPKILGSLLR